MVLPYTLAPQEPALPADDRLGRVRRAFIIDVNVEFASGNPSDLIITDASAIEQEVLNVILTPIGTDEHEPTYGSQVPFLVYDPVTPTTARAMRTTILSAVKRWLRDRIADLNVIVAANNDGDGWTAMFSYVTPGLSRQRRTFRIVLRKR